MLRIPVPARLGLSALAALCCLTPSARAWGFFDYPNAGYYLFKGPIVPPRYSVSPSWFGYKLDDTNPTYFGGPNYREYYNYGGGYGMLIAYPRSIYNSAYIDAYGQYRPHLWALPRPFPKPPPPPPTVDPLAHFLVQVPGDAEVWLEGVKMHQTGPDRRFASPPLEPGIRYGYTVRARWLQDGQMMDQTQVLTVRAGAWVSIHFPVAAQHQ